LYPCYNPFSVKFTIFIKCFGFKILHLKEKFINENQQTYLWGDKMGLAKEFMDFLKEYKVLPLAIAFIMGVAINALVKSLVDNVIMPIVTPFIPGGGWQTATFSLGPIVIGWGAFLGEVINFVIIALVIFFIAKKVLKEEKVKKK
jgi:large conductance mechanosensitive channel